MPSPPLGLKRSKASTWSALPRTSNAANAARYSHFVSWMKVLLPLFALGLIAIIIVYSSLLRPDDEFSITFTEIATDDDNLRMLSPKFTGMDAKNRTYLVTADTAIQQPDHPEIVDLANVEADIATSDSQWVSVSARDGQLNTEAEWMDLHRNVSVFHSLGYELHSESAYVAFGEGWLESRTPVEGQGPLGTIKAQSLRVEDFGRVIRFTGDVTLVTNLQ